MDINNRSIINIGKWEYRVSLEDNTAWITKGTTAGEPVYTLPQTLVHNGTTFTIESIDLSAFSGEETLTELYIPDSYTYIDEYAFCGCSNLRKLHIGKGLRHYMYWSFKGCPLEKIDIDEGNPYLKLSGDRKCILSKDGKRMIYMAIDSDSVTVPYGVKILDGCAISCSSVSKIALPPTLETLEGCAIIENCNLTELIIPEGVREAGFQAFMGNESLRKLDLPSTLTYLNGQPFVDCFSLQEVILRSNTLVEIPQSGNFCNFRDFPYDRCVLKVPTHLVEQYRNHKEWSTIKNIVAI